tara:strand:+ start:133 stop:360 length:228 start_codon:yes stop_codon:yes gene_type:complete
MGEKELISRIGELNGVIEHYCEHIMVLNNIVGTVSVNKVLITPRIIELHKIRLQELKNERYKLEQELIESLTAEV